jgi:predicted amidohydrolase YtcJ
VPPSPMVEPLRGGYVAMSATLLRDARVWGEPGSDCVLLRGGRIAWIGRAPDAVCDDAECVTVHGGLVLPGFVDGHTHLVDSGLAECGWDLNLEGCSREEALARLAEAGRSRSGGEWLVASGWDESHWLPRRRLERGELDGAVPAVPVIAVRVDGHLAVLSTVAVDRARSLLAARPALFDAESGDVREELVDDLRRLVRPDGEALDAALRSAAGMCHRLGITTAHVLSGLEDPSRLLASARRLSLRLVVHPPAERLPSLVREEIRSGDGDEWARWGGVKLFADGSVGARNAAFSSPYLSGERGMLNHSLEWMSRRLAFADRTGWQTLVHAIGDRAIEQVLQAHRRARTDRGLRHRIEHYEFPTAAQIDETRGLGLSVCMQPNFIVNWSGPGGLYERTLGAERDAASNPIRAVLDAGIPTGFGSDGMPLSPLFGMTSALRAPYAGQRIAWEEAVDGYTLGSAGLSPNGGAEKALAPGNAADLVVLDDVSDEARIGERRVSQTWVGGTCVYREMEDG